MATLTALALYVYKALFRPLSGGLCGARGGRAASICCCVRGGGGDGAPSASCKHTSWYKTGGAYLGRMSTRGGGGGGVEKRFFVFSGCRVYAAPPSYTN